MQHEEWMVSDQEITFSWVPVPYLTMVVRSVACFITFQCFFLFEISPNFEPEKYDFDLYKGFSMEKMAQIRQVIFLKLQIAIFL
jgi:hypothetical protein